MNQKLVESLAQIITSLSADDRMLLETKVSSLIGASPSKERRTSGQDRGLVIIHDDFEAPLSDELLNSFLNPDEPC